MNLHFDRSGALRASIDTMVARMSRKNHIGSKGEERPESFRRTVFWVLVSATCYYLATQIAWALCFPNSKVSLFFPPHAVLVSVLLLVPTRHWWAYTLAALGGHLLATQQAHWPFLYALHCEAFDAVQNVATAAGIRLFIKSPLKLITLRDAIVFVLIAVVIVPFGTAFWGAAFTVSNHFGTHYWVEWRNLGISNAVTAIVLVPAILLGAHYLSARRIKVTPARLLEACLLGMGILAVGIFAFDKLPAGPDTSPALLYAPIPLLVWAALRFGLGGTSAACVVITFQAIWGTMLGLGPFLKQSPAENALALQMFLLFTATPLMFLAVLIEEEKRSQAALRESEARFRDVANTAPVLIWMSGTDKLCNFVNKGWLDFTGRTLEQDLGNSWAHSVHPDDLQKCLKIYTDAFDARQPFFMEYRLRRHDGEYRWICDTGKPRLDSQGNFVGYIGSCLDITQSRRKADALIESGNRLRAILDTAVDGIITINDSGVIESVNAATEKIFGYAAAEMIGQNVSMLMPASFRDEHDQYSFDFQHIDSSAIIGTDREVRGRRKDGSVFPMDLAMSRIDLPGRRLFTGFVRDITERKQSEKVAREFGGRLLHAQEGERARLARELHDDITQRMARLAIDVGRVESGRDGAGRSETMREVREGLVRLSEDVHALSYRLHPSTLGDLGLADALRAECERFSRQASIPTEVKLVDLPATIPPDAALSLFRITQESLRNIDRHAHSHTAAVSLRSLDGGLQLAVTDTGIGFDPGQQRHRPSLGLESMRERVRLLGGELDIESAPGHGTTILAWVPLKG
jgi:PAS domain S-box-containing protein